MPTFLFSGVREDKAVVGTGSFMGSLGLAPRNGLNGLLKPQYLYHHTVTLHCYKVYIQLVQVRQFFSINSPSLCVVDCPFSRLISTDLSNHVKENLHLQFLSISRPLCSLSTV